MTQLSRARKSVLKWGVFIIVPLIIYFGIVINRSPNFLRPLSLTVRFSFLSLIPVLTLLLWGVFSIKGWWGRLLSFSTILALFALALAGIWASGQSDALIMTGLLPISDARGYYLDANLLLENQPYSVFSSRRPFFAGLLATLLRFTQRNLQMTVAILVLMTAISCYLAARAVRRSHGALAATVFPIVIFLFYRRFAGTTMTENLGLSLGALSFALLWRALQKRSLPYALLGLGILTVGLIARAGPFFLLIGVVLTLLWFFKGSKIYTTLLGAGCVLIILIGFGLNTLMFQILGNKEGVLFTNFSYSFYGLATGGQRWDAINLEHPEVFTLSETEQPTAIYTLIFDHIRQQPMDLVRGVAKQYYYLVSNTWYNAYGYVSGENTIISWVVQYILMALSLVFLIGAWWKRKDPFVVLLWFMFAGLFISVPFVPPGDTNRMRAYATVIPVFALLPALGLSYILQKTPLRMMDRPTTDAPVWDMTPTLSIILMVFITIVPVLVRWTSQPAVYQPVQCENNDQAIYAYYTPGSFINVHEEGDFFLDWLPDYHQGRYTSYIHSMPYLELVAEFQDITAPTTVFEAVDLNTYRWTWVFIDGALLPNNKYGLLGLCGQYRPSEVGQAEGFFDASKVFVLSR